MIQICGKEGYLPINELIKVSDLIYFDGPLLSHYIHRSGDNYLSYWVDCDETSQRWLVFRVGISMLQKYVNKGITLRMVLQSVIEKFVYLIDVDQNGLCAAPLIVSVKDLPADYLPDENSYYDFSSERDVDAESLSLSEQSGLFEIHFSGDDVRYGIMPFEKYTRCLQKIEELRSSCANGFIRKFKKSKDYTSLDSKDKNSINATLQLDTKYQYVYSLAGSVRVLLKPQNLQMAIFETTADSFAKELIRLFQSGFSIDRLREYADEYGHDTLVKFNELLEVLDSNGVDLEISWINAQQKIRSASRVCGEDKNRIMHNLSYTNEEKKELCLNGRFYSLNTKSGAFNFETLGDKNEKLSGKFDETLFGIIQTLTFEQDYEILIEQKVQIGLDEKRKDINTIIAISKFDDEHSGR